MVRETSKDEGFAEEFERRLARRRVIHTLTGLRGSQGLSQKDLAERMGCTQSRVSKLEASDDDAIAFGDLKRYAGALGLNTQVGFATRGLSIVDRVKVHAFKIKHLVGRLAGLAEHDPAIARGVSAFFGEAAFNFLLILQDAADKLPGTEKGAEQEMDDVEVYGPNEHAEAGLGQARP